MELLLVALFVETDQQTHARQKLSPAYLVGAKGGIERLPAGRMRAVFSQAYRHRSANREALHLRRLGKRVSPHYGSGSWRRVLFS
jgi:hypothetical protein